MSVFRTGSAQDRTEQNRTHMALPPQLKAIQHHLRTAQEHDKRDPVVAYYCE
ncbi:Vacuolar protein sorting-associated protein VTA1-like protein, partial [Nibea albiflora]